MSTFSRGQRAQIDKRIRLRGAQKFTPKDRKCIICGHNFRGPSCIHTVEENQDLLDNLPKEGVE